MLTHDIARLAISNFKLSREYKLMWPFLGAAYHHDSGRPRSIWPSEQEVVNTIAPSGAQSRAI
jgi:hypothetical protein